MWCICSGTPSRWCSEISTDAVGAALAGDLEFDPATQTVIVKRTDEWIVSVAPMIFNDRVLLTHRDEYPLSWTAGFCYDKGGAAMLAAIAWNPDTEREPVGHKKVAGDRRGGR